MFKRTVAACVGAALLSGAAGVSSASVMQLVNFAEAPLTPPAVAQPEFQYTPTVANPNPSFFEDTGSVGNGDGNLPPVSQNAPGLVSTTPLTSVTLQNDPGAMPSGMGTTFYDTSLYIYGATGTPGVYSNQYGLVANGPAQQTPLPPTPTVIDSQALSAGAFAIYSTAAPPGPPTNPGNNTLGVPAYGTPVLSNGSKLLLLGTIDYAVIEGVDGGTAGATFSAMGITYTGGDIYSALIGAYGPNAVLSGNDLSISMTDVTPPFGVNPAVYGSAPGAGQLNPFNAEATGLTDVAIVPEPASASVLVVAGVGLLARRRSRRSA